MKKIGLVTYYGDNYGALLQAYALQSTINKMNCNCTIINYQWTSHESKLYIFMKKLFAITKTQDYMKKRKIMRANFENFRIRSKWFQSFREEYINIENNDCIEIKDYYKKPPLYDYYVCGSDQIWNPNFYKRCNPIYFLDFAPKGKKRIAYAPSIGVSSIDEKYKAEMSTFLNRMDLISVRELAGANIIKELTGKDVLTVLDPTLLLTSDEWQKLKSKINIKEQYIFCYLFSDLEYIGRVKEYLKKKTGLKVVCLPYSIREMNSDDQNVFGAGPAEFVHLIKNAALVLTDSFHATVFSINMKTPFYSLLRSMDSDEKNMNSRLYSILELCNLSDRIITPESEMLEDGYFDIDFNQSEHYLEEKRRKDLDYLKTALDQ